MSNPAPSATHAGAEPSGNGDRIRELDGLRGIAVALVIAQHAFTRPFLPFWMRQLGQPCALVLDMAWCGVDIFFVLSVFLIGGIVLDHRDSNRFLGAFYARRTTRIVPAYLLLVGLAHVPFGEYGSNVGQVP